MSGKAGLKHIRPLTVLLCAVTYQSDETSYCSQVDTDAGTSTGIALHNGSLQCSACNYLVGIAWEHGTANKYKLQELGYRAVREQFGLARQLTVRAIARTCEAFKRDKNIRPEFRPHGAITYDARQMSFNGLDKVSLLTLEGRAIVTMVFRSIRQGAWTGFVGKPI